MKILLTSVSFLLWWLEPCQTNIRSLALGGGIGLLQVQRILPEKIHRTTQFSLFPATGYFVADKFNGWYKTLTCYHKRGAGNYRTKYSQFAVAFCPVLHVINIQWKVCVYRRSRFIVWFQTNTTFRGNEQKGSSINLYFAWFAYFLSDRWGSLILKLQGIRIRRPDPNKDVTTTRRILFSNRSKISLIPELGFR